MQGRESAGMTSPTACGEQATLLRP
ncbi:hypothetical protein GQ600_25495 [Phytophthora cactorum]|nr:hypothetical protein GQ600_25495 [Phytophthora cactorum]